MPTRATSSTRSISSRRRRSSSRRTCPPPAPWGHARPEMPVGRFRPRPRLSPLVRRRRFASARRHSVASVASVTVDARSRLDGSRADVDAGAFFDEELPVRIEEHADAIVPAIPFIRPRPVTIEVDGDAWTLTASNRGVTIARGPDSEAVARVRLSSEQLTDLVDDQKTFMSLWAGGTLDQQAGTIGHLLDWW